MAVWVPKEWDKALRPPGTMLWRLGSVDLLGKRLAVQVVVTDDL